MELLQLEYFRELAHTEHLTKTAQKLYISQSAVSNSLHRLEQELGVPLFDRVGRGLRLNPYGRIFLEGVETAFNSLQQSRSRMQALLQEEQEKVRILAFTSMQVYPTLFYPLISLCPNLSFLNKEVDDSEVVRILKNHEADLCLKGGINPPPEEEGIRSILLHRQPLCIVVSRSHPLAAQRSVCVRDLGETAFASGSQQKKTLEDLFRRVHRTPRILFEGNHLRDILMAVLTGRYALLATWEACRSSGVPTDDLIPLPIDDVSMFLERRLYWRDGDDSVSISMLRQTIIDYFEHPQP